MKIEAAIVHARNAPFTIETVDLDAPAEGEVLVQVVAAGICHTDLSVISGTIPFPPFPNILGHEGAGIVAALGPGVTDFDVGDHVVMSFAFCGTCARCSIGEQAYCEDFFTQNFGGSRPGGHCAHHGSNGAIHDHFFGQSSFASHALVAQRHLVKVPKDIPLELLAPLGCGLQTGAGAVLNYLRPEPGSSLAVFGTGAVGLAAIMAARVAGCGPIIAVDIHDHRLALALELGATHAINSRTSDLTERIMGITGRGMNYSVEATGIPAVMAQAVELLAKPGKAALLGASNAGAKVEIDARALTGGNSVRGIIEGDAVPRAFIPQLITLYREGRFPMDRLIRCYAFDQINQAASDAATGATIKPVIRMPHIA